MAKSAVPERYAVHLDSGDVVLVEPSRTAGRPWKVKTKIPSRDTEVDVDFVTETTAKDQAVSVATLLDQAYAKRREAQALEEQAVTAMADAAAKDKPKP